MKNTLILMFALLMAGTTSVYAQKKGKKEKEAQPAAAAAPSLKNFNDSISYALGVNFANGLKSGGFDSMNLDAIMLALTHYTKNQTLLISLEQTMPMVQTAYEANQMKMTAKNTEAGEKFLAENKTKEGVVTTASGLQYKVNRAGTGPMPGPADEVTVHYTGKLIDGKVFDSSVERGEPITFPVNGVIPGWVEALQLMPKGSAWTLYIPYSLAYGEQGAGQTIPPYSTLIFDVELLDIKTKEGGAPFPPEK